MCVLMRVRIQVYVCVGVCMETVNMCVCTIIESTCVCARAGDSVSAKVFVFQCVSFTLYKYV